MAKFNWTINDLTKHLVNNVYKNNKMYKLTPEENYELDYVLSAPIEEYSEETQSMWVLLKALYYYGSIADDKELPIVEAQIGALRANLMGEEHGWRK